MITLTENAVREIKRIMAEEQHADVFLRVAVRGGGCGGLTWKLELDPESKYDDFALTQDGIKIAVDKRSVLYIDGLIIHYISELDKRGFLCENPNMSTKCGCGSACS